MLHYTPVGKYIYSLFVYLYRSKQREKYCVLIAARELYIKGTGSMAT